MRTTTGRFSFSTTDRVLRPDLHGFPPLAADGPSNQLVLQPSANDRECRLGVRSGHEISADIVGI
jgi:hypothetical protein